VVEAGNYNQHSATMNSLQDISQFRNQIFQNLGKGRNAFMAKSAQRAKFVLLANKSWNYSEG
jgi:hypothetical protein